MAQNIAQLFQDAYAIIWDMDGVLVDSESYHFVSHKQALAEAGVPVSKEFYIHHGVSTDPQKFYTEAFTNAGKKLTDSLFLKVHYRKLDLYQSLQKEHGIKIIQPATDIVKQLYLTGVLMAIVSQVDREEVTRNMRLTGLLRYFPLIVAGGDFGLPKKPAPDIYRKALELLNVKAETALAIEDSANGAFSVVAAGIPCLVVTNEYTKNHIFPKEAICSTFAEIAAAIPPPAVVK